jgi:hypothetical protein
MFCSQCGTEAALEAKFCANCGSALGRHAVSREQESPSSAAIVGQSTSVTGTASNGPSGVGGWLLLLVVGMMVLGPMLGSSQIEVDFRAIETQYPNISSVAEWNTYKTTTRKLFLLIAAISFYGGWGLARGRDRSVVRRAKVIL